VTGGNVGWVKKRERPGGKISASPERGKKLTEEGGF